VANVEGLPGMYKRSLTGEDKREIYPVTRKFGLLAGICTSPFFIIFAYFGDSERGSTAWFSAIVISVAIRMFWALRKRVWFWITITLIALVHVPLTLFVSWPFKPQLTFVALLPVGLLDLAIVYGIIRLVENVIERNGSPQ
jgi:hypothetical protein